MAELESKSEEDEFSDEEEDEAFNEDMESVRRACALTGTNPNQIPNFNCTTSITSAGSISDSDNETSSVIDDVELVKKLQQSYNLEPVYMEPLKCLPPVDGLSDDSDVDCEDDYETWSAIERRFASYMPQSLPEKNTITVPNETVVRRTCTPLGHEAPHMPANKNVDVILGDDYLHSEEPCNSSLPMVSSNNTGHWNQPFGSEHRCQPEASKLPMLSSKYSGFLHSKSSHCFIDAIKKNRSFQKLIRNKLIQIEAKIEENKKLKERIKLLKDFQMSCKRKAGKALTQKKDARIQLISSCNSRNSRTNKVDDKKVSPLYFGPVENSHVAAYRMVMQKFPHLLRRERWSDTERENLGQAIKQQFQETLFQKSLELFSDPNASSADSNTFDDIIASITDFDILPENFRSFVPKVDWERLASLFFSGRSGAECEARWLNHEDPLINHNPWTRTEDKNLLYILEQQGIHNWINISTKMATHRTPFQCLSRYQRSLNASIIKREWTAEIDAQLRSAVEIVGLNDWQRVASYIEGKTGTQCSNRWKKTLNPAREKVGRWTIEEDKHLKVAVMLFGAKTWNKIAQFVPGRTQVQCRERWVNILDPSMNLKEWTSEEDCKLKAAISEHGYCWSKVAEFVPFRTDSQCMRRWRVLFPHEVPMLKAAQRVQRLAFISNFVDREEERPALGPNDFLALPSNVPVEAKNKGKRSVSRADHIVRRGGKSSKKKKDTLIRDDDSAEDDDVYFPRENASKKKGPKSRPKKKKDKEPFPIDPSVDPDHRDEMHHEEDPTRSTTSACTSRKKRKTRKPCPRLQRCDQELPSLDDQELPPSSRNLEVLQNADNCDDTYLDEDLSLPPERPLASTSSGQIPDATNHVKRRVGTREKVVRNSEELEDDVPLASFLKERGKRKRNEDELVSFSNKKVKRRHLK